MYRLCRRILRFITEDIEVDPTPEVPVIKIPTLPILPETSKPLVAFVRGHTKSSQGAINYLGEREFYWSERIGRKCQAKLLSRGVGSVVLTRANNKSYHKQSLQIANECKELGVKYSCHLHFNRSFSGQAIGCEVLVNESASDMDNRIADFISDQLNEKYGFKERHKDGVKTIKKGHGGFTMMNEVSKVGVIPVLPEACFAGERTKESRMIFEQEDNFVDILVECYFKVATNNIPKVD